MDALTRRQFDRAMFAKERTLAIRVGDYASRDIKEASFEYGYIKGDTYKPGGTCAGSGKITFTSIITTFNKLDTLHPEIGLLVGDTYQWVKMGEYFINDIEIDRNRNTTTLELMDGMFKLNREYVTDLHFPAEVREVIQEICLKTGIELANDYFGISAMRYHIEQVPEGKKLSFRDMLSAMTQMIGMSCFFNREGKMEIRDLTESNITINADSYFLHGLTKSEIEYQISGITCKTDKKSLTVGMKTGRSLELDNVFMTQSALNDLYYKLKNLTYYPYNLNYQGHLLLEVGQWVTIQTNKKETFKVPVLSQSFTFKGGLRGRISADSKAGNDTQYSYEGTITKHIKQQDDIEAKIQAQIEAADKDFDQKVDKIKKDFNNQVELAKARAEEVKRELSDTINQRFNSFDNGPLKETKHKAEEALRNAGASTLLAQEAKRIGLDSVARLEAFKSQTTSAQTALSGDLDALKRTIANDIRPKQAQAEAEIAKQAEALSRTKNELAGASTLLAQEAKRIELDSVARLEAFKSQTTSAQTALSGDLDVLKQTIANDIRPKQAQAEAEIAKQVEALSRTKNELSGVKSAQATYEETTTRRLSELTNLANGKASKSELTQTAEELSSKIASVQASGRNLFLNSLFKQDISKTGIWTTSTYTAAIDSESKYLGHKALKIIGLNPSGRDGGNPKVTYPALGQFGKVIPGSTTNQDVTISFYAKANKNGIMLRSRLGNIGYKTGNVTLSTEIKRYVVHIPKGWTNESKQTTNEWLFNFNQEGTVWIWMPKFEISDVDTSYSEAPEDIEGQISTAESTFKQRANSLEAGVSRLTEGLRTKADISSLNVTAENIRQSVKSLETDTQNKLNQKLSQAEFEVRAGSIRQEILNATKDKASKSELTQTAEELASKIASVHLGRRNLLKGTKELARYKPVSEYNGFKVIRTVAGATRYQDSYVERTVIPTAGTEYIAIFYARASENDYPVRCHFYNPNTVVSSENSSGYKSRSSDGLSIIRLSTDWQLCWVKWTQTATDQAKTVIIGRHGPQVGGKEGVWVEICAPAIFEGNLAGDWSPAYEDQDERVSAVESNFKQRADSLEAGVSRLTEGLRTKADISSLNVTAENIRQSVKSLETDTQNKLNQKLSQAEFEVRAGSIRQEILNATKDKASKSELTQTAEELSSKIASVQVGGRNYIRGTKRMMLARGLWASGTFRPSGAGTAKPIDVSDSPATGFDKAIRLTSSNARDQIGIAQDGFYISQGTYTMSCWVKGRRGQKVKLQTYWQANDNSGISPIFTLKDETWTKLSFTSARNRAGVASIGYVYLVNAEVGEYLDVLAPQLEDGSLATSSKEAPEDIEGQISTVESTFKQRANSLAQEAKRIELDSVARLEAFKSQTTSAQTALSGDLDVLKQTIANDIRPKQAQAEAEIAKQVEALSRTKNELAGVKSAQATYKETTTRRLSELTNLAKDKASKSELTQTAEELASRIASVKVGGRNYYRDSEKIRTSTRFFSFPLHPYLSQENVGETWTLSFDLKINEGGEIRPLLFYHYQTNRFGLKASADITPSKEWQRFTFTGPVIFPNDDPRYSRGEMALYDHGGNNNYSVRRIKLEKGTLATDWSPAPEDIEGQISTVESTFKQRANSLEAGVSRLTEGLRTKADISSLNVTAENIRQSVKTLETDTQNKLNQKLSQAEFEVRAGSIRQEILNATKDKADKTLVTAEAGKLREELTSLSVGENLFVNSDFKNLRDNGQRYTANGKTYQNMIAPYWHNPYNAGIPNAQNIQHGYFDTETFSDTVFAFNESDGSRHWKALSTDFKIGVISAGEYYFSADLYATDLGTHIKFGFYYHNSTGKLNFYAGRTKIEVTEKGRWTRLGIDLKVNDDIDLTKKVQFYIYGYNFARNSILYLKKPKVSKGRLKSDWSPALEDTEGLITEAKATFERTAQGLRTDLSAIQEYVNKDGQRQEALQRYTREESTRQATAVRELVNRDFVGKATYQEDVKGINQRIEAVKTSANKDIASQIASYRQSVDGKFTDISSQITTYKQDVGGQISGLSNRLTSSEQGTTTQISNLSNRINSNKQGTDNHISNLKTQVATNKDNAERQMGRISDQVSANKANADSQFANVTNQLARKVETTDFQRVKETSKLYERILGNTENGIADKVARMALTNQLFQVEVGKYSVSGPNLIKNSDFKNGTNEWGSTQNLGRLVKHSFYHNGQKDLMRLSNATKNENFLYSHRFNLERNTDYVLNFRGFNNSALASYDVYILGRRAGESDGFTIVKKVVSSKKLSTSRCEDVSVTFNSGEMDNAYIRFDNNGSSSGTADLYITEVDLYKGYKSRTWQPHPEDAVADANKKLEATQTKMTLLTGSWAVQNINSAGDIISGINLGANGHNRFVGKLTHITGETLIDRAVIKSAMVDKLKTANFEAGSVTTTILDAEAVTAEKLKVDNALIRKLTANDAFIDQLTSKRIFSTKVESVISSSTFLEAYQGRIGGFTLGQFDQGGGRWISGVNQFSVGMGNGAGHGVRTAFWANWGNNWNYAGPKAWNVNTDGKMYCRNEVGFYDQVDFSNSSRANFYGNTTFSRSPVFSNGIELGSKDVLGDGWNPKGGRNAVVWWNQVGSGSVKYWMEQKSDRRLKENITDTAVKALDKINRLRMVAFDFIENKKHEEIGLIAQEAETIVPRIVSRDPENPDGYLHIDYTALVPYLIKAIQELNQKIEKMEKTIA
ncbi:PblB [Streptococcus pneumoniae]|nr:tail fiber domain-containing protein [Streptococcus pneumoniae]CJP88158.1 PblB [Streptococcus pneumoniae]